ncbi:MAG: hypothetical protein V4690_01875 [Patescibacteria group bacterium]
MKTKFYFLWQTLVELAIVFMLILVGLALEVYNRDILFLPNGNLNQDIISLSVFNAIFHSIIFVVTYRFVRRSYYAIGRVLSERFSNVKDTKVSTLIDVFLITASLLATVNIRPIIYSTYLDADISGYTYNFVKHDALFSVVTLLIIGIPLVYLIYRRTDDTWKRAKIFGIILVIAGVGVYNSMGNYNARLFESSANWVQKNWSEQTNTAQRALSDAETNEEKAYAYYWLGVSENRKRNHQKAVEYQTMAISFSPYYAAAYASLANAYLHLKEYDKSRINAQKCIDYDPEYAWCYQAMANYYWTIGEEKKALLHMNVATSLDPYDFELRDMRDDIEMRINNML